jgi:hypothetical protein
MDSRYDVRDAEEHAAITAALEQPPADGWRCRDAKNDDPRIWTMLGSGAETGKVLVMWRNGADDNVRNAGAALIAAYRDVAALKPCPACGKQSGP